VRHGGWFVLCGSVAVALASQTDPNAAASSAPIRRVVVYKDGHCFTQREATVILNSDTASLSELPHALLGTVWAYTRDRQVKVVQLRGEWLEERREIAPQNVAELLALNEGAQVELTLMFPSEGADSARSVSTEIYRGTLRLFKPQLRYTDAYPTHDPPPPYSPQAIVEPRPHRDRYSYYSYWSLPTPPDYVQDEWSRTVSQSSFALETAHGLVMFSASQVKRVQFLGAPKLRREVTLRRPRLTLLLSGAKAGQRVPLVLAAVERGIRWIPEYQLVLPTEAGNATLQLHATLINELSDLRDAEVAVAVGAPQFIMQDHVSPLTMRQTFMRLSRWFGEPEDIYQRAIAGYLGGFGGLDAVPMMAPSSGGGFGGGGMGLHVDSLPMVQTEPARLRGATPASAEPQVEVLPQIALIQLPRVTLPKNATAHYIILQQSIPYKRICYWTLDLTEQERDRGGWYRQEPRRFRTFEEIAYELIRRRNLWGEVQDALLIENKGNIPWTTAPATILQGNAVIGQDMLLFTPPGEEAVLLLGPAPQVNISHTLTPETRWDEKRQRQVDVRRGTIRVSNSRQEPVPLTVRIRFVGHYRSATQEPTRVTHKTVATEDFWNWYYRNRLQINPYTELVWEMLMPPGTREWEYRYEVLSQY
jgi:hypothetical protein